MVGNKRVRVLNQRAKSARLDALRGRFGAPGSAFKLRPVRGSARHALGEAPNRLRKARAKCAGS